VAHCHRSVLPLCGHSQTYRTNTANGLSGRPPALIFAADEPRVVRAEVEPESAAHVAAGQKVTAQEDGAKAALTGTVLRVSDWFLQRRAVFQEPALRRRPDRGVRDRPGRRPPSPEDQSRRLTST
jgi:hypothetical protein